MIKYALVLVLIGVLSLYAQRWVHQYEVPGTNGANYAQKIIWGNDGNLYACGVTEGNSTYGDITIISYTPSGTVRWIQRYDGVGHENDHCYDICYGADNNIYVVGDVIPGALGVDAIVLSYTSSGTFLWAYLYNGPDNVIDEARAIVYGDDGNLYVCGVADKNDFTAEARILAFSLTNTGSFRWDHRYPEVKKAGNIGYNLVFGNNTIYVCGTVIGTTNNKNMVVISLTTAGAQNWVYQYNGPSNQTDEARDIVYGGDGFIYTTGESYGTTNYDWTIIKLNNSGSAQWVYRSGLSGADRGRTIVYGADGNLYGAGESYSSTTGYNFTLLSVDINGIQRWIYQYNEANLDDLGLDIAYGIDNYIYATGYVMLSPTGNNDIATTRISNSGTNFKISRYDPAGSRDEGYSIVSGTDTNIYVAGRSTTADGHSKFTVLSYAPSTIDINEGKSGKPGCEISLNIYPNPFHKNLTIRFPKEKVVNIKIFDTGGRLVRQWDYQATGQSGQITWDGTDDAGFKIPAGVYMLYLDVGAIRKVSKVVILE